MAASALYACTKCTQRYPFEELSQGQQLCKVRGRWAAGGRAGCPRPQPEGAGCPLDCSPDVCAGALGLRSPRPLARGPIQWVTRPPAEKGP